VRLNEAASISDESGEIESGGAKPNYGAHHDTLTWCILIDNDVIWGLVL